jgi:hypothetical protein
MYPDYVTSDQLKAHLRITDNVDDTAVALAVTAASRAIDRWTQRQFGQADTAAARVYSWDGEFIERFPAIRIDDLMTLVDATAQTDYIGDGVTLTTYDLFQPYVQFYPYNADADGRPWTHIVFLNGGPWTPSGVTRELIITAKWGWLAVPDIVQQATLIQAGRFFVRRDSQYGIAGSPETGTEMRLLERLDPDVALMLGTVRRLWGAV